MSKYKGIIFDLDGAMLDTEKMNIIPLQRLIKEELGKELTYESLLKYMAYPGKKTLELLGFENIEKSYDKWVKYVNEFEEGAVLFNGFHEVIKALDNKGIICGIASSKMQKQYEIDFLKTGLQKYIKGVILQEDTENHKPHPEPLLAAAKLINLKPQECMYIGDTLADYKASKAAGMDFGLAYWGAHDTTEIEEDYRFETPKEILEII